MAQDLQPSTPAKAAPITVSFQENVKGWVSFKSFVPENGIACANNYFTFKQGGLYRHHDETGVLAQNTFYNTTIASTVDFIFNQASGSIKSFETINYEGTQAFVESKQKLIRQLKSQGVENTVSLDNYNNIFELNEKKGWFVQSLNTEQDKGALLPFVNKEDKWFNYIQGINLNVSDDSTVSDYDPRNFANQGLGTVMTSPVNEIVQGCTCNGSNENGNGEVVDCTSAGDLGYNFMDGTVAAFNYYDAAVIDDGSCVEVFHGCTDPDADNYNPLANTDNGGCFISGCTDPNATNYNEFADVPCGVFNGTDNDCCVYCNYGCTNSGAFNYDSAFNCDGTGGLLGTSCIDLGLGVDCDCQVTQDGCTDTNNYDFSNTILTNYNANATNDDGSCIYSNCSDINSDYFRYPFPIPFDPDFLSNLNNNNAWAKDNNGFPVNINSCNATQSQETLCHSRACWSVVNNMQDDASNSDYQSYFTQLSAISPDLNITTLQPCPTDFNDTTNCTYSPFGCTDALGCTYDITNTIDDGSCLYCGESQYFNYDGGLTLSGNTCGPSTQSGNCVGCPIVDANSMDIQSLSLSEVSFWFEVSFDDQVLINLGDSFPLGGKPNWLNTPGFRFRVYHLNTVPPGGSHWTDADYEVVDFTSAFGAPGSGFDASHGMISGTLKRSTFKSTVLKPGITSVVGSRQGGVISTSTGYNGSTTLSLDCGQEYMFALQTQCLNPDNNHSSTSDWQQVVGKIQMDPCTTPDVFGCPSNPLMFNSDCESGNLPTVGLGQYTPCQDGVTIDDGSCVLFEQVGCMDPALVTNINAPNGETAINYNFTYTHDCNGNLPAAGTYGNNSCCVWRGCTDPTATGFYDPQANFPDHNVDYSYCEPSSVNGCTDPTASNYDPNANTDDGSCTYGPLACGRVIPAIHPPFKVPVTLGWDPRMPEDGHVFSQNEEYAFGMYQSHFMLGIPSFVNFPNNLDPFFYMRKVTFDMTAMIKDPISNQPVPSARGERYLMPNTNVAGDVNYKNGGHIKMTTYVSSLAPTSIGGYYDSSSTLLVNHFSYSPEMLEFPIGDTDLQEVLDGLHSNDFGKIGQTSTHAPIYEFLNFDPTKTRLNQEAVGSYSSTNPNFVAGPNADFKDYYTQRRYDGNWTGSGGSGFQAAEVVTSTYASVYDTKQLTSPSTHVGTPTTNTYPLTNFDRVQPWWYSGGWVRSYGYSGGSSNFDFRLSGATKPPHVDAGNQPGFNGTFANMMVTYKQEVLNADLEPYCPAVFVTKTYITAIQGTDINNPTLYSADDGSGLAFATQQELVDYFNNNYKNMHREGWTGPGPII